MAPVWSWSSRTGEPRTENREPENQEQTAICNLQSAIQKEYHMIYAYVLIEAEPTRVQDLIKELPDMELDGSVIKQVHAVTGRYDLIAFVESPDMQSLGN